jgi:COP9 signalosome complex subunit 2
MSDSEDYEYEYDDSDQEAMDDGGGGDDDADAGGGGDGADDDDDEDQSFEYTDDEGDGGGDDDDGEGGEEDGEIALENSYYNAKGERDAGDIDEARATFESVIRLEVDRNRRAAGDDENAMDVEDDGGASGATTTRLLTPLKHHGPWSYKAIKQLVKLHLRSMDGNAIMRDYTRMLRVSSSPDAAISPNAMEKGVNGMLDRVSNLIIGQSSSTTAAAGGGDGSGSDPRAFARDVYDLTLEAFHPATGICPNERLWFKTNLKYGQLLYEMNETSRLQGVIRDLLISSGQAADVTGEEGGGGGGSSSASFRPHNAIVKDAGGGGGCGSGGTHAMEIAALQIQLYSRLKDTKRLRSAYQRAISVRGGIPHPRTLALIQELGGKMHMSQRNFHDASQSFFQAFKSYDEAGDRSRLRCLKYLVMASMLHASTINPFDSHEARAHRDDPEIVAMTNLVQAFHNDDIRAFERILSKNEGRIMDDEFVREHVADLLRTIRTQVILRIIGPYTRIRLSRIAGDLNNIPIEDVEGLLVSLILDGKLDGHIDQVRGILVKKSQKDAADAAGGGGSGGSGGERDATNNSGKGRNTSIESRHLASIMQLTTALEHLTTVVSKVGSKSTSFSQQMM